MHLPPHVETPTFSWVVDAAPDEVRKAFAGI